MYSLENERNDVLIIDDNEITGYALGYLLNHQGLHVQACRSGEEALALSKNNPFLVYVLDYRMPEMTGDRVASELRKMQPEALIIGFSVEFKEKEFESAGANGFILKENLATQLIPVIRKLRPVLFPN